MEEKLRWMAEEMDALKAQGLFINLRTIDSAPGAWMVVDGQRVLNLCTNNYLGLAGHPALIKAAQDAVGPLRRGTDGGALDRGDVEHPRGTGEGDRGVQKCGGRPVCAGRIYGEPGGDRAAGGTRGCDFLRPAESRQHYRRRTVEPRQDHRV